MRVWMMVAIVVVLLAGALPAAAQDCDPGTAGCYCLDCDIEVFRFGGMVMTLRGDTFPAQDYELTTDAVAYWLPGFDAVIGLDAGTAVKVTARVWWRGAAWLQITFAGRTLYIREGAA